MRKILFAAAIGVLAAAAVFVPLPLFVISPGSALSVADRVDLAHEEDEPSGELLLTTVHLGEPSTATALSAWIDDDRRVIPRRDVVPEGTDNEQYFEAQRHLFQESTQLAAAVGLRAAGLPVTISGDGAMVVAILPDGPAEGVLQVGDVIVAVDGTPVDVASDLVSAMSRASSGHMASLTVRRGDDRKTVDIELEEVTALGRPGLGVAVQTRDRQIDLPFDVKIDEGRIGGPSAGLMVALTVHELADADDLTAGRVVAGTGTVDAAGNVGAVGGVPQKVDAAVAAGADLFLVPANEAEAALTAADDRIRIVAVRTLDDAIAALRDAA